eukprot:3757608-Pyramimonas_sp.AAC.1
MVRHRGRLRSASAKGSMDRATHNSSQTSAGRMATLPSCSRAKAYTLCRVESSGGRRPKWWQ